MQNVTSDKKAAAKTPAEDLGGNSPVISDPCQVTDKGPENVELEKGTSGIESSTVASLPLNQDLELHSKFVPVQVSDAEMQRQGQAATKAQAAFRGYLARRAFSGSLKGIIRLQALIRGHLVRRQAVATLRCMEAVVKIQALARGRRVRLSDSMHEGHKKYNVGELQASPNL
ncbi:UNVERIFIED_CONTAM: protein IQ-DOMAIN 31 [Sesamum calycinum]|uniref:Protein IQ-DOMAIN 31 n=1 Tax=Sesamum calycinum TaxID=2727403 RepID=A0AAW2SVS0_9LAMI